MSTKSKKFLPVDQQLALIERGTNEILPKNELISKLKRSFETGKPLVIKAGFDPSAPDLHLGHTVLIQKMKQFQDLGHTVVFLIGDFTGMIGDPTGKSAVRKLLTREEVQENAKTYKKQVFKILDPDKTEVRFNSEWMEKMSAAEMIEQSTHYTVARMLERDDFSKRFKEQSPISIREFMYPLVQGYDSVILKSDIELGGNDQKFNLLVGREMQKANGQEAQVILTVPLLEGLDGVQKMSKSLNNYIGITESAKDIFGKTMSLSDQLMIRYYELLSDISTQDFETLKKDLASGKAHPLATKKTLARELVDRFCGQGAGDEAQKNFEEQFSKGNAAKDRTVISKPGADVTWIDYLHASLPALNMSKGELRRLMTQNAVRFYPKGDLSNEKRLSNPIEKPAELVKGDLIKIGKHTWAEIS
ncbi:MAG: tyrosine--tRNA ligase [Bdellovibrionota bacterium]